MSNVIDFRTGLARAAELGPSIQETGRQRAGRMSRRNSLRKPCRAVESAVLFSGQLERGDEIYHTLDVQGSLEKGIQAARHLAVELEKALAKYKRTPRAEVPTANTMRPSEEEAEAIRAMVRRMMAEFEE